MAITVTYAGVKVPIPTTGIVSWIESHLPLSEVLEFLPQPWPASRLAGSTISADPLDRRIRLNCLYWPNGASDFATVHILVSEDQLAKIRDADPVDAGSGSGGSGCVGFGDAFTFEISDTDQDDPIISTDLSMLPARPLQRIDGLNGLYLLTLVDERYWWWNANVMGFPAPPTTWQSVLDACFNAICVSPEIDDISQDFMYPACEFEGSYEPVPMLLDAAAYNTQHNVVRLLDGTVRFADTDWCIGKITDNLANDWSPQAGGLWRTQDGDDDDAANILPAQIAVGVRTAADWKTFASDIDGGTRGVRTFRCFALANSMSGSGSGGSGSGGDLCDDANLQDYVDAFTDNWVKQLKGGYVERQFAGIVPWIPDGIHDGVEWTFRQGDISTRVRRCPWHDGVHLLMARCDPAQMCLTTPMGIGQIIRSVKKVCRIPAGSGSGA